MRAWFLVLGSASAAFVNNNEVSADVAVKKSASAFHWGHAVYTYGPLLCDPSNTCAVVPSCNRGLVLHFFSQIHMCDTTCQNVIFHLSFHLLFCFFYMPFVFVLIFPISSASYAPNIEKFNKADGGDFSVVYSYGGDVELWYVLLVLSAKLALCWQYGLTY